MKKLAAKLSRSAIANMAGLAGGISLVAGAWSWRPSAGMVVLGVVLLLAGWAVDE